MSISRFSIAIILLLAQPSVSQASWRGTLRPGQPVVVEVVGSSSNSGRTAVTIAKVVRQDRYEGVDAVSAPPNGTVTANVAIGSSVQRLIVTIDPPEGGTASLRVMQGFGNQFENQVQGDTVFVYDVVDDSSTAGFSVRVPPVEE